MARAQPAALTVGALVAALLLAGCASAPAPGAPAPRSPDRPDAAGGWQGLLLAPLGTRLADLGIAVHEVLLFRDAGEDGAGEERTSRECRAPDRLPARLDGLDVQSYLMCFAHDRLARIELTVGLPADDAGMSFARLCDRWRSGTTAVAVRTARHCDGAPAGGSAFSADLGVAEDGAAVPLSITVYSLEH